MIGLIKGTARQVKSVSGLPLPIATYNGNLKAPIKKLSLSVNPTQSGSGDPYPAGGGKNKLDGIDPYTVEAGGAIYPTIGTVALTAGTTYTFSCKQVGTPTSGTRNRFAVSKVNNIWDSSTVFGTDAMVIPSMTFTPTDTQIYYVFIWTQGMNANLTYSEFQCEVGSSATDYAPYSNIRPITGVSSVNLYHTGKNVVQTITNMTSVAYVEKYTNWSGGMIGGYPRLTGYWKAGTYTFSMDIELAAVNNRVIMIFKKASDQNWYYINSNNEFVPSITDAQSTKPFTTESTGETTKHIKGTITIPEDIDEIRLGYWDYNNRYRYYNLMVELGSTASDYSAYQGDTYLIQLGDTYYGATLDVLRGKLVVDRGYANLGDVNWSATSTYFYTQAFESGTYRKANGTTNIICENYKTSTSADMAISGFSTSGRVRIYDSSYDLSDTATFKTAMSGVHIVYELATPFTVNLGSVSIPSLLGVNNIWHDGNGDVDELVFQNRQLYYGR